MCKNVGPAEYLSQISILRYCFVTEVALFSYLIFILSSLQNVYYVRRLVILFNAVITDYRQRVSMQCQRIYIQRVGVCVRRESLTVSRFILAS